MAEPQLTRPAAHSRVKTGDDSGRIAKEILTDTMDFDTLKKKYFRFWNVEDLPTDDTFDKYQEAYFREEVFDVDVTSGRLNLDLKGENWACSVSAVVIYPVAEAAKGERFLEWVEAKRRFHFNNCFKRVLHRPIILPRNWAHD